MNNRFDNISNNISIIQNISYILSYNILSVKHILLECPITTELFQKKGYDLNAYNNVRQVD